MTDDWRELPKLAHLRDGGGEALQKRRRLRKVRYTLFRVQTAEEAGRPLATAGEVPDGLLAHFLGQYPKYAKGPHGGKQPVPAHMRKPVAEMGGFKGFARKWDVDHDLVVYVRFSSIWQEWNATLSRVVPVLGE